MRYIILAIIITASTMASAGDPRCCVEEIKRTSDGRIYRSKAVLRDFKKLYPCPSTGLSYGACPGWSINHTIPLFCGGRDIIENLSWVPNVIKACMEDYCIDRYEGRVYCNR